MNLYQEIKSHFTLPNAYTDWANYRATLTDYLIASTNEVALPLSSLTCIKENDVLPTLAVYGAGSCNDLDLSKLSGHFSSITLLDSDMDALQCALSTYDTEAIPVEVSFTGITDSDYQDFCEELQFYVRQTSGPITRKSFATKATKLFNELAEEGGHHSYIPPANTYDYAWCFGVHSQLYIMFVYIYHAFLLHLNQNHFKDNPLEADPFIEAVKMQNQIMIPQFNQSILTSTKKTVFMGCEWDETSPVEGACQAIEDIRARNLNTRESIIHWPFDSSRNITYDMLIQRITI